MADAPPKRPRFPFSPLEWTFVVGLLLVLVAAGGSRLFSSQSYREDVATRKDLMILFQAQDSFTRKKLPFAQSEELLGQRPYLDKVPLDPMLPKQWLGLSADPRSTCTLESGYRVSAVVGPQRKSWAAVAWRDNGEGRSFVITNRGSMYTLLEDISTDPWGLAFPSSTAPEFQPDPRWEARWTARTSP